MRQQQQRTGAPAKLPAKCVHSDGKQSFAFAFSERKQMSKVNLAA